MGEMGEMIRDEPRSAGWAEIDEIAFRERDGLAEDLKSRGNGPAAHGASARRKSCGATAVAELKVAACEGVRALVLRG